MTTFESDTAVTRLDDDTYEAHIHPRWWVVRGPHGGYLASILLRALSARLDIPSRPPRSLTVQYAAAPAEGAVMIRTAIERSGSNATSMSARMTQGEKIVANALATFSGPWRGFAFVDAQMPETTPVEDGMKVPTGEGIPAFLGNFDMRWTLGGAPFSGADRALVGGWLRLAEPQLADHEVVATLMDAWAPAVFPRATEPIVAPTLDLTIHFRTPVPLAEAKPDDHYLGVFSSSMGADGFSEEDGELWSADGRLIAQSRQLALALTHGP